MDVPGRVYGPYLLAYNGRTEYLIYGHCQVTSHYRAESAPARDELYTCYERDRCRHASCAAVGTVLNQSRLVHST